MDTHIKQAGLHIDLMAMHTTRKQDPTQGAVFETVASYPVPFSVQQTDATVWEGLFKGHPKGKPVVGHVLVQSHARVLEMTQSHMLTCICCYRTAHSWKMV